MLLSEASLEAADACSCQGAPGADGVHPGGGGSRDIDTPTVVSRWRGSQRRPSDEERQALASGSGQVCMK